MIENYNESKSGEFVNVPRYIGVASVNIVAINPNNATLRKFGWNVADGAEEPEYVTQEMKDGKTVTRTKIRFLVQIQDFEDKPVIPIDFWIYPDIHYNTDMTKCEIIDRYGQTAWATKDEIKAGAVPQYANGPATICTPYKPCHRGEATLVAFLMKYLNMPAYSYFNKDKNARVINQNPGALTIDNWKQLAAGTVKEIAEYVAYMPDNCLKMVLGLRITEDNKAYQTYLRDAYLSNASRANLNGEYSTAKYYIDKQASTSNSYLFSATAVKLWEPVASKVADNSTSMFNEQLEAKTEEKADDGFLFTDTPDDLPFD